MSYKEIRSIIEKERRLAGMSKSELARKAGLSRVAVFNYLEGKSEVKGDNLESLLKVFGYTLKAVKRK